MCAHCNRQSRQRVTRGGVNTVKIAHPGRYRAHFTCYLHADYQ